MLTLKEIERYLSEAVDKNQFLSSKDLDSNAFVEKIREELSKKRFIWLGNKVYVPNKVVCHLHSPDPDKLEELEVILNSPMLVRLLSQYISSEGYYTFGELKLEIKGGIPDDSGTEVEFCWPSEDEKAEDITVRLDDAGERILEVNELTPEIPRLARLSVINGEVYRENYLITKKVTNIGRLRNVIDKASSKVVRRNDFIFARNPDPKSPNSTVSRQHAKIVFRNGDFYLYDEGSANGTSIERIGLDRPIDVLPENLQGVKLENFDILRFGTAVVRFEDNAQIGARIDKDAIQQFFESETSTEVQTTIRLTREQINEEMRKLLNSE
ncbi:MAG: FHA domain-containing protein [Acidobacteriota bacterium]|nr:FHA domain-containing protein [Blastocatellia bacterium]MDW8412808.1 FHA domain-containing protein [Acidobacteriota bacterium]